MIFCKIAVILPLVIPSTAYADGILSILGSKKTSSLVQEKAVLVEALRKEIKRPTAEQNIFFSFLAKDNFKKALFQWNSAFERTSFASQPTGVALYSYLLFKNNLKANAVEKLFTVSQPAKINKEVLEMWKLVAPSDSPVWEQVKVEWNKKWLNVFGPAVEIRLLSRQQFDLKDKDKIFALLKKSKIESKERHQLEWQMALSLALKGDIVTSAKVLSHLLSVDQKKRGVDTNLLYVTVARLLYQQGYLDAAVDYYKKVEKKSEYWFTAQEEMGWSYIRKGEPQNTLAVSQTSMVPEFKNQVGPEMVFLTSLAQLKVCDYPAVVSSIKEFRSRFKKRSENLLDLQKSSSSAPAKKLIGKMKAGRVKFLELGELASFLPRYVSRDEHLYSLVKRQKALEEEAKVAGELYALSISEGTAQVGFQAEFEAFKKRYLKKSQLAENESLSLIKRRAKEELREIKNVLQKMHIVEAELVQQLTLSKRIVKATKSKKVTKKVGTNIEASKYDMVFPFVGERWFDELGAYKVDVLKGCQAKRSKK